MKKYSIRQIADLVEGKALINAPQNESIDELLIDSRKIARAASSLFFAIKGDRHNGHNFVESCLLAGVHNFVVTGIEPEWQNAVANFIVVEDTLAALQKLAGEHRRQFSLPVVGITGSNGKTIVKEWLFQLMRPDKNIVRSPKSYNSQTGVPLSVWQIDSDHEIALIEAGISQPGEMEHLQKIIQPTIGIFTNIGTAHDEHFENLSQKVREKLQLFASNDTLIYCKDYNAVQSEISTAEFLPQKLKLFTWSKKVKADLQIGRISKGSETEIQGV